MKKTIIYLIAASIFLGAMIIGCNGCKSKSGTSPTEPTPTATLTPVRYIVDDMEDGDNRTNSVLFGGYWYTYDDLAAPNNGDSIVWPMSETAMIKYGYPTPVATFQMTAPGYNGSAYCARISGTVTSTFQYSFIGMGFDLLDAGAGNPKIPINFVAQGYTGLKFWYKNGPSVTGSKNWKVKLCSTYNGLGDSDDQPRKVFTATNTWQQFDVALTDFTQEGWCSNTLKCYPIADLLTSIVAIQFQTDYRPGAADLMVDDIELVK